MNTEAARPDYLLSGSEMAVLKLVTEGLSDEEIASRLRIASPMASAYVGAIQEKMGSGSRTETAIRAMRDGLALGLD